MTRRNERMKLSASAKVIYQEKAKEKNILRQAELYRLIKELEDIGDIGDAISVQMCILTGRKVVLTPEGEIELHFKMNTEGLIGPLYTISENKELYDLLKNIALS